MCPPIPMPVCVICGKKAHLSHYAYGVTVGFCTIAHVFEYKHANPESKVFASLVRRDYKGQANAS